MKFSKSGKIKLQHPQQEEDREGAVDSKIPMEEEYYQEDDDQNDEESSRSEDDLEPGSENMTSQRGSKGGMHSRSYVLNSNGQYERIIRKRKRKSSDQIKILMREFDKNPNWSKETLLEVSKKTGLSEA